MGHAPSKKQGLVLSAPWRASSRRDFSGRFGFHRRLNYPQGQVQEHLAMKDELNIVVADPYPSIAAHR
jgi:hypothetical protein